MGDQLSSTDFTGDDEIDRNARAYGWEIGKGHPLVEQIEKMQPDNPFLNKNWRENLVMKVIPSHPKIIATEPATKGTIRLTIESEIGVVHGVFTPDPGSILVDET